MDEKKRQEILWKWFSTDDVMAEWRGDMRQALIDSGFMKESGSSLGPSGSSGKVQ